MSHIYYKAKEEFLDGTFQLTGPGIKVALCEDAPAVGVADPKFSDLTGVASDAGTEIVPALGSPTYTSGVLAGSATTFADIDGKDGTPGTTAFDWIVIVNDTGTLADARCICAINGFGSVAQTGGDIVVNWDTVTSMNGQTGGIFAL